MNDREGTGGIQELVERAKAGDAAAIAELLETLRPRIRHLARRYTDDGRGDTSTSDFVQEAWVRAWERLEQFRGGADDDETRAMLHSWIDQIVRRLGLNAIRDRKALKRSPADGRVVPLQPPGPESRVSRDRGLFASDPSPSSVVRKDEHAVMVREAIEALPDADDRTIVRLRFIEGLSLREISERTGISYDRTRSRFQRALEEIERRLGGLA